MTIQARCSHAYGLTRWRERPITSWFRPSPSSPFPMRTSSLTFCRDLSRSQLRPASSVWLGGPLDRSGNHFRLRFLLATGLCDYLRTTEANAWARLNLRFLLRICSLQWNYSVERLHPDSRPDLPWTRAGRSIHRRPGRHNSQRISL